MFQEYYNKFIILLRFYFMIGLDMILLAKIYMSDYWKMATKWISPKLAKLEGSNDEDANQHIISAKLYSGSDRINSTGEDITVLFRELVAAALTPENGLEWDYIANGGEEDIDLLISYRDNKAEKNYKIIFNRFTHPVIDFHQKTRPRLNDVEGVDIEKVFFADLVDESVELTDLIREYAGPNQDFHGHHIDAGWIRDENGRCLITNEDDILHIIDYKMQLHQFKKGDAVKFLQ